MAATLGRKRRFVMKDGKVMVEDYVINPDIYKAMGALLLNEKQNKHEEAISL